MGCSDAFEARLSPEEIAHQNREEKRRKSAEQRMMKVWLKDLTVEDLMLLLDSLRPLYKYHSWGAEDTKSMETILQRVANRKGRK